MAKFKRERPEARGEMLSFRASSSEIEYLKGLADARGLTLAELIREALDDYLGREGERRKVR